MPRSRPFAGSPWRGGAPPFPHHQNPAGKPAGNEAPGSRPQSHGACQLLGKGTGPPLGSMSSIYSADPPTTGKAVIETTYGPLEIELWCKEAPRACRNFIQLAMEGYYDRTCFHRVIPAFCVQGGDPTGTGAGGCSIYDNEPIPLELHSRLQFNRRGLLATATASADGKGVVGSQFFFTLSATPELQKKHTIFGKVVGNSLFNLLKMGEAVVDESDKPLHPPVITGITVLKSPFEDIVPRRQERSSKEEPVFQRTTAIKSTKLLSFEDCAAERRIAKVPAASESMPSAREKTATKLQQVQGEMEKVKQEIRELERLRSAPSPSPAPAGSKKQRLSALDSLRLESLKKGKVAFGKKGPANEDEMMQEMERFKLRLHAANSERQPSPPAAPQPSPQCRLHQIENCKSCKDTFGVRIFESEDGWLHHRLVFEKEH